MMFASVCHLNYAKLTSQRSLEFDSTVFLFRRRRRNKSEGAAYSEGEKVVRRNSPFELDSEMDFPALGSSCDSKVGICKV